MKRAVFGECVQGFSHIRSQTECQDSCKMLDLGDGTIVMAVADGHGSKSCPYSKTGSEIAVNVFCDMMSKLYGGYQNDLDVLPTYLNREGSLKFAQTIELEWKRLVLDKHRALEREIPMTLDAQEDHVAVYHMYGSTLLGLLLTPTFLFAFQIGDGDITYVTEGCAEPVVQGDKLLGVESHSLCSPDAWKKAISAVHQRNWTENVPSFFMLSTDGFANSFLNDQEFARTCTGYLEMMEEHGPEAVEANLKSWLEETSRLGCGDDITALIAYFSDDARKASEPGQAEPADGVPQEVPVEIEAIPEAENIDAAESAGDEPASSAEPVPAQQELEAGKLTIRRDQR